MRLNFNLFCRFALAAIMAAVTASAQQMPTIISLTSAGNIGAGPNGIAATANELLYTQPFCAGKQTRGTYNMNRPLGSGAFTSTLLDLIPETGQCSENYLTISTGLGGFTAGDRYATGSSITNPTNEAVYKNGSLTPFIDMLPAPNQHAGITFDTAGTFGFDLIVTLQGSVNGYNSAGMLQFTYLVPTNSGPYLLEGATVAPLTYGPCPGCLYITGETASPSQNPFGAIFFVRPNTPSGAMITKLADSPGMEPEGIVFVGTPNPSCSLDGYSYFVSGYGTGSDIDFDFSTSGAILAYTPAQLASVAGQFLVPDEGGHSTGQGIISAFSAETGTFSPFSTTQYQLEGSTIFQCPVSACVIPPSGTAIGGSPVSWNRFNPQGPNNVVWINAHIGTPSGVSTTTVTTVNFTGVTFQLNGQTYALPDGLLIFNPSAPATPSTTFDATFAPNGRWTTTVNPSNLSDEIFFDGNALPVDSNISGGGQATLTYTTTSSDNNLKFDWQWSAAAYTFWPGNNQAQILAYHHTDHAGTPENRQVQQSLIQGPRGGGGSNFTGSWSGTGHGACPGAQ